MMPLDLTVAIPIYNGATRLPLLLEKLHQQIETESLSWEILAIDNNSTDNTLTVLREAQKTWPATSCLRFATESKQGAAFARIKAVREARGELVGFLDDDTLPDSHWVAAAVNFGKTHPRAGAYGSRVRANYEIEPPEGFERIAGFLAIVERGTSPHIYQRQMKLLPPSAGLVVRRQVWQDCAPEKPFLTGRTRESILNSEDLEVILCIQNAGWEIWYNPEMEIYHQIPRDRLTRDYLLYLVRSTGLARHYIRMLRLKPWQRPLLFPLGFARDITKAVTYFLKHRQQLDRDTVAACEMEFLRSSIISPFYLWKQSLKR